MSKHNSSLLLLDIGNTRAKWSYVQAGLEPAIVDLAKVYGTFNHDQNHGAVEFFDEMKQRIQTPMHIVCVSVSRPEILQTWQIHSKSLWPHAEWIPFNASASLTGLHNCYQQPQELGADRWAALMGAQALIPNADTIVVNAGTATTIDYLKGNGSFEGGWIVPGLDLMLNSLAMGTAGLPDLRKKIEVDTQMQFGQSTQECILHGCVETQIGTIYHAIQLSSAKSLCISGGNADLLLKRLVMDGKSLKIIKDPYLVLRGLYRWYMENN